MLGVENRYFFLRDLINIFGIQWKLDNNKTSTMFLEEMCLCPRKYESFPLLHNTQRKLLHENVKIAFSFSKVDIQAISYLPQNKYSISLKKIDASERHFMR